ncbi:DUF4136 domain-containing protein [Shewanella amazonensis]|uniref:DUF4136 domain-containing protein n=1 Tax=Shewanella amazonensis (strain ATCC BAA-1098 / SB2B) TaxID=326297 RepID=A1S8G6_SHEAM|nr:DUF4136 domain-containing protein [Shewanella amazonensis]ABM00673.1 conserved hypothetical protein [Shewanella amazonensis SB2B]
MKKIIVVAALLALSACSSMKTSWDFDPGVTFNQYKTYAWVEKKDDDAGYHLDGLMDQRVRDAIETELAQKGFSKSEAAGADLLVNYLTKVDKKINVDTFNTSYGYNPYWGPGWGWGGNVQTQTTVREYEVGTLIIDLIDNKSGKLVWRGSVADTIRDSNTPQERETKVREAVAGVMLNYPPKSDTK